MNEDRRQGQVASAARTAVSVPTGELEQIFLAQHGRVFRAAYRITGNASDAEDVLQTVFLRLARQGWAADAIADVGSYLHRAAINAALDLLWARQDSRTISLEDAGPALPQDSRLQPDRRQDARELRACLRKAIAGLTPRAAEMFVLRYFEGYGNAEIAQMLGMSVTSVAVTLHRSRGQLQEEMRSYLGDKL